VFSGLRYIIIYIPRSSPSFYISAIVDCCVRSDIPQESVAQAPPPIWSILTYMLLTESRNVSDETLRQKFSLPVLNMSSNLEAQYDAGGYGGKLAKSEITLLFLMALRDLPRFRKPYSFNSSIATRYTSGAPARKMARSKDLSYPSTATLVEVGPPCTPQADHASSSSLPAGRRKTKTSLNASSRSRATPTLGFPFSPDWSSLTLMENIRGMVDGRSFFLTKDRPWLTRG
jgi:hypothetical protein